MADLPRVVRAAAYLVAVGALAGTLAIGLTAGLRAVGEADGVVSPVAISAAVAVALAVADVYTPIGRGPQSDAIRDRPPSEVVPDVALAGTIAAAVAALLAFVGLAVWSPLGNEILVLIVGIGAGYAAFMLRNREYYLGEQAE